MFHEHLLASGANGRGQGVARPERLVEVGFVEDDVFGLQDHAVAATFDVDRAAAGGVGSVVGNDRVRFGPIGGGFLRLGELPLCLRDLAFKLPQFVLARRGETVRLESLGGGLLRLRGEVRELGAEPAAVVLEVAEQEPGLGQLGGSLVSRCLELVNPPLDHFRFGSDAGLFFGVLGGGHASGLQPGLTGD